MAPRTKLWGTAFFAASLSSAELGIAAVNRAWPLFFFIEATALKSAPIYEGYGPHRSSASPANPEYESPLYFASSVSREHPLVRLQ